MKSITLLILCTLEIRSERWYSATVGISEPLEPFGTSDKVTNFRGEDKFLPIGIRGYPRNHTWHFKKQNRNDWQPSTFGFKPEDIVETKIKSIRKKCHKVPRMRYDKNKTRTRFLEVFQVVQFDHVLCTSSSGLEGSCLYESECRTTGGTAMGSCADGYGTCCVNLLACDSESSAAMGWFTNPNFPLPSTERLSCAVTLKKFSEDVTQIRLDFYSFELLPPTEGVCQLDQFVVSGQNINNVVPILCGINTGQHVYIEVGETEGPIYLTIQTETAENRLFSIKVTQITPTDELAAPQGCLQYFTEPTGYLESFNYRDKSDISIARAASYFNNLNYAICIERAAGTCSVTYNAVYMQIVNYDTDGLPVIPPGQAGVEIFNCPSDWLLISATRLCGDRLNDGSVIQDFALNAPVTGSRLYPQGAVDILSDLYTPDPLKMSKGVVRGMYKYIFDTCPHLAEFSIPYVTDNNAGPIVVWFRSDEGYVGRGFRLEYEQNPCATTS